MHNKVREPLFHIVKRDTLPWYQAWGIRAIAIVLALLLCALITTLCTHLNPLKVFGTMFSGAFGSSRKIWILGQNLAVLLCISLAVTPAFKMRFWNIGAEGQVLAGGLAAAACMICLGGKVPNGLLIVLIVIAGIAAGAVWAAREFGVQDREILSAIRKHTLGDAQMSALDALIYTADFIEPNRTPFPGLEEARSLAETDIFAATRKCAELTNRHLAEQGRLAHPRTLKMLAEL